MVCNVYSNCNVYVIVNQFSGRRKPCYAAAVLLIPLRKCIAILIYIFLFCFKFVYLSFNHRFLIIMNSHKIENIVNYCTNEQKMSDMYT